MGSASSGSDRETGKADEGKKKKKKQTAAEAHYICVDMSGSIRSDDFFYASFVARDLQVLAGASDAPETHLIMWGSDAKEVQSMDKLLEHLSDDWFDLGATCPRCFVEKLPSTASYIDLTVVTDGEIFDPDIESARSLLAEEFAELRVRRLTLTYVNSDLRDMNMGLSVIFESLVDGDLVVRVKDEYRPVQVIEVGALGAGVTVQDILEKYITMEKTQEEMRRGVHHLSQRFSKAGPQTKLDIRQQVRNYMKRFIDDHRSKQLSEEDERRILENLAEAEWPAVKQMFVGFSVPDGVKLVQVVCQKFLNETRNCGGVVRISAYLPVSIEDDAVDGEEEDGYDEVLLDDITFRALGEDAVLALPCQVDRPTGKQDENHIDAVIDFDAKLYPDNLISLQTLFELYRSTTWNSGPLQSSQEWFGTNPFNRAPMSCVLLLPVQCSSLPAKRLEEIDRWNKNMLSRYTRCGRYVPSLPLSLALILEPLFSDWERNLADVSTAEERARMSKRVERVRAACRAYLAQQRTPATFSVGLAVVVKCSFRTAATLACRVLLAGCNPRLPIGVLTHFWTTLTEVQARACWAALLPYAELEPSEKDKVFPLDRYLTLKALASGVGWKKSGRHPQLRKRRGLEYSIGMFTKYLDHLLAGGCAAARLRHEELFIRRDLFGVPFEAPLLCMHGVELEECEGVVDCELVLCHSTGRPTLLNRHTLDMWYVRLPELRADQATRSPFSFHRALCLLLLKKDAFPDTASDLVQFVCSRARAFNAHREVQAEQTGKREEAVGHNVPQGPVLLPTQPCRRMIVNTVNVFSSLTALRAARPDMTVKDYLHMLKVARRRVCEAGPCCAYIREACTPAQVAWINEHATFEQVGDQPRVLNGEISYRNPGI